MMTGKSTQKNIDLFLIVAIVIAAAVLRLSFFAISDNFAGAPPLQRLVYAQTLDFRISDHNLIQPTVPLLYAYMLKAWISVFGSPLVSSRFLSLLFGLALPVMLFLICRMLFSLRSALFAGLLTALLPVHIIYSGLSLEETPYYFLIFSSLYFFLKYTRRGEKRSLYYSAVLVSAAFGFRFEAAVYALIIGVFLWRREGARPAAVFLLIGLSLPLAWALFCAWQFRNPLISYLWQSFYSRLNMQAGCDLTCLAAMICQTLPWPLLTLGLLGFFVSRKTPGVNLIGIFFAFSLSFVLIKLLGRTLIPEPKYSLSFTLFYLVYIARALDYLIGLVKPWLLRVAVIAALAYPLCIWTAGEIKLRAYRFPDELREVSAVISRFTPGKKTLVDRDYMQSYADALVLLTPGGVNRFEIADEMEVFGHPLYGEGHIADCRERLLSKVASGIYEYIVYSPEGRSLKKLCPLGGGEIWVCGIKYRKLFSGRVYEVYRIAGG